MLERDASSSGLKPGASPLGTSASVPTLSQRVAPPPAASSLPAGAPLRLPAHAWRVRKDRRVSEVQRELVELQLARIKHGRRQWANDAPADALASPTDSLGGGRADIFVDHASVLSAADMRLPLPRPTPSLDEAVADDADGRDIVDAPLCAAMLVAAAPAVVREYGALRG